MSNICSYRRIRFLSTGEVNSRFSEVYTQLCFLSTGGASSVSSVFGRTGTVVATSGDYSFAQIGSTPTTVAGYGITDAVTLTGSEVLTNKTLTAPTLTTPALGTPASGNLSNCTALPVGAVSGLGSNVAAFLATPSSTNLISAITDETGSGALVFANTPTLVTPVLGVASATTINKVTLTAPATGSTLTIADGKVLTVNSTLTLTGTDSTTMTFPTTSASVARSDAAQTFTGTQTFSAILVTSTFSTASTAVNANLNVGSAGGAGNNSQASYQFGAGASQDFRVAFRGSTNATLTADADYGAVIFGAQSVTEAGSGTHGLIVTGAAFNQSTITNGAGATTNAVTVYIKAAPTGITPTGGLYALFSDAGFNRFDGATSIGTSAVPVSTAWLQLGASTTSVAQLNLPTGSAPSSPVDGDIWREDNTNTGLKIRVNGVTKTVTLG